MNEWVVGLMLLASALLGALVGVTWAKWEIRREFRREERREFDKHHAEVCARIDRSCRRTDGKII